MDYYEGEIDPNLKYMNQIIPNETLGVKMTKLTSEANLGFTMINPNNKFR